MIDINHLYNLKQLKDKINSGNYNAELLLQHAIVLLEQQAEEIQSLNDYTFDLCTQRDLDNDN